MERAGPYFPGKAGCFSVRATVKGHYSLHKSKYTGFCDDRRGCILVDVQQTPFSMINGFLGSFEGCQACFSYFEGKGFF